MTAKPFVSDDLQTVWVGNDIEAVDPLVSTAWLAQRLGACDIAIVDASWYQSAQRPNSSAEIPAAVFFAIDEIAADNTDLPHMGAPC